MMSNPLKGYLAIIGAALLWATSGTAGKKLINEGLTAFDLVQVRVTVSALLLAGAFLIRRRDLFRIRLSDVFYFVILGGVILAVAQTSYFYAIGKIQTAAAILLQYLAPILVAVYSICFWKERLTVAKILALVLAMCGVFFYGWRIQSAITDNESCRDYWWFSLGRDFCRIHPSRRAGDAPVFLLDGSFLFLSFCRHLATLFLFSYELSSPCEKQGTSVVAVAYFDCRNVARVRLLPWWASIFFALRGRRLPQRWSRLLRVL